MRRRVARVGNSQRFATCAGPMPDRTPLDPTLLTARRTRKGRAGGKTARQPAPLRHDRRGSVAVGDAT